MVLTSGKWGVNLYKHVKTKQSIHSHPAVIALAGVYIFHMPFYETGAEERCEYCG